MTETLVTSEGPLEVTFHSKSLEEVTSVQSVIKLQRTKRKVEEERGKQAKKQAELNAQATPPSSGRPRLRRRGLDIMKLGSVLNDELVHQRHEHIVGKSSATSMGERNDVPSCSSGTKDKR